MALSLFTADLQADEKGITAEECEERFKDFYCEDEPEDSWKRKRALIQMNAVADQYLSQYRVVEGITEEFRSFKTESERSKSYNKELNKVAKELPKELSFKLPYTSVDGTEFSVDIVVPVEDGVISKLTKELATARLDDVYGDEFTPEKLATELNYHLDARVLRSALPKIVSDLSAKIEGDILMKLKNARNPLQPIVGAQPQGGAKPEPPSHAEAFKKMK